MKVALLGYRSKHADRAVAEAYTSVLRAEKLETKDLKPYGHNVPYMKAEDRALLMFPAKLDAAPPEDDERHPGRKRATVAFELARGGYATLVVKKLRLLISEGGEAGPEDAEAEEDGE
jgi:tRNA(Glu) U13 pseudouridine synthase TruD